MVELAEQLEAARAEVARLERRAAQATCAEIGHRWKSMGGANCGCHPDAYCSVAVHECTVCGDCDYGENAEADSQRRDCLHAEELREADRALSDARGGENG